MIFRQLFDQESYTYTYLLASSTGSEAILIDPVLDKVDRYLQLLDELDLKLVKVADTHVHADHITGMGALRDRTRCVTLMGEQSKVNLVSQRFSHGEFIAIDGVKLQAIYTPGHTYDSYCFLMEDRVFTGDTLFIRGTGRTDFQQGDAAAQYDSIFGKLLTLPEDTLVYPGHDYKGDTVSTIGEEKRFNPRLQVNSSAEYIELMANLGLDNPKMMDVAVPVNLKIGLSQDSIEQRGWSITCAEVKKKLADNSIVLVDLREDSERKKNGIIEPSRWMPYGEIESSLGKGGSLLELAQNCGKDIVFYCAFGERSAMALQMSRDAGLVNTLHLKGGMADFTL